MRGIESIGREGREELMRRNLNYLFIYFLDWRDWEIDEAGAGKFGFSLLQQNILLQCKIFPIATKYFVVIV